MEKLDLEDALEDTPQVNYCLAPSGTTNYRIGRHRTASDLWAQKMCVNWGSRQA